MTRVTLCARILLATGLAVACSGSGEDTTRTESNEPAPSTFGSAECDQCVSDRCNGELAACATDAACADALDCVTSCPAQPEGMDCVGGCFLAASDAEDALGSLLVCLGIECEDACGMRVDTG